MMLLGPGFLGRGAESRRGYREGGGGGRREEEGGGVESERGRSGRAAGAVEVLHRNTSIAAAAR